MKEKVIDINEATVKIFVESMRPDDPEIRSKLDIGYSYEGNVFEIFEIRPQWNDPKNIQNFSFARIRYYKSKNIWKLYWRRASGKWELYEPNPTSTYLKEILIIIDEDSYGCFKG